MAGFIRPVFQLLPVSFRQAADKLFQTAHIRLKKINPLRIICLFSKKTSAAGN